MQTDLRSAEAVGERIRVLRESKGISKEWALAKEIGCSQGLISRWECGASMPPPWRLRQLADVFGCTLSFLVAGEVPPGKPQLDPVATPGAGAAFVERRFKARLEIALGEALAAWCSPVLSVAQLQYLLEPCALTLLDIEQLDAGSDMKRVLNLLATISGRAEQAFNEGLPGARDLLFNANDKAVHFKCYVVPSARLLQNTNVHFGRMSRLSSANKALLARQCGRLGDVYKICSVEAPGLRKEALELFRVARGESRTTGGSWEYHNFRSPGIVAGSTPISHAEFEEYISWLDDALQAQRHTPKEGVHLVEGRADAMANRYNITKEPRYKTEALRGMADAQSLARKVGKSYGKHNEMWLRTERLEITLWKLGIKDHISAPGMDAEAAVADKAWALHTLAKEVESDRIAEAMLKEAQALRQ